MELRIESLEERIAPDLLSGTGELLTDSSNNNPGENNTNLPGNQPPDGGGDNPGNNNPGENNTLNPGNETP
jgi:hypothetical protein